MGRAIASAGPHPESARVDPVYVAVHLEDDGSQASASRLHRPDALVAGERAFGDGALAVSIERVDHGHAATLTPTLRNRGAEPVRVQSVVLGLCWRGHGARAHRMLRNGWQSWSLTEWRDLDHAGEPSFPSGPWLRGMHHSIGAPDPTWSGWHESETLVVVTAPGAGPVCLVGVMEQGAAFGVLHLRGAGDADASEIEVQIDVELRLEIEIGPGESRALEAVRVAVDDSVPRVLECFAELWGTRAGARIDAPMQTGWCSWYHYFHDVTEDALRANLEALAADRSGIPVDLVQLDDGYQRQLGDWLETNAKFPSGLPALAQEIRAAGFRAGLWTAPFAASAESALLGAHPDYVLRDAGGEPLRGTLNPAWSANGWAYALDTGHPGLRAHLESVFRELVGMGFDYLKLDFLYMAALHGRSAQPSASRAQRLRAGLEAIRAGAGEDAFLLGCGCPLGAAVGIVDGMRIGPDVAPSWDVAQDFVVPGLEPALPSTRSALRSTLARAFMHRRLWLNDPDCLMVRRTQTGLSDAEAGSLAALIAVSGGMTVVSDDVASLPDSARAEIRRTVECASRVDAAGPRGVARHWPADARDGLERLSATLGPEQILAACNFGPASTSAPLPSAALPLPFAGTAGGADVAPHATQVVRVPDARRLAVFCDFDGTFSVKDVGSTLAVTHLGDRRAELRERFERGELDAWTYAVALFDGFAFGPAALDAFLPEIELDPGARGLLAWCEARAVPFRILSDGFDYNLERLQEIHGVRFDFASNGLRFEDDRWRISAGGRNPECHCGTGSCKRAIIRAYRTKHPDAYCVHIGNGRVSDLCGAEEADLAFAKDTLAPALRERGVFHHAFATLDDVRSVLDSSF